MSKTKKIKTVNEDFEAFYKERFVDDVCNTLNELVEAVRHYRREPEIVEDIKNSVSSILAFAVSSGVMELVSGVDVYDDFVNVVDSIVKE